MSVNNLSNNSSINTYPESYDLKQSIGNTEKCHAMMRFIVEIKLLNKEQVIIRLLIKTDRGLWSNDCNHYLFRSDNELLV